MRARTFLATLSGWSLASLSRVARKFLPAQQGTVRAVRWPDRAYCSGGQTGPTAEVARHDLQLRWPDMAYCSGGQTWPTANVARHGLQLRWPDMAYS